MAERSEALMRIVVGIVSGVILTVWKVFIQVLAVVHFVIVLFTGKRNSEIAGLCEIWNTQAYSYLRYMTFVTNKRPFPFENLDKNISQFK